MNVEIINNLSITAIQCILLLFDIYVTLTLIEKFILIKDNPIFTQGSSKNMWIISILTVLIIFLNTIK